MNILTFDSPDAAATALAARVARAVHDCPELVIGLPAGRTMIPVYAALRRLRQRDGVDSSRMSTFQIDEFIGLPAGHPGSFRRFLEHHLLDDFGIDRGRMYFLDGRVPPGPECQRYERVLAAAGGLDLQILGIGRNGHIGFNEPDVALAARTHVVTLHEETRRANVSWFDGQLEQVPRQALSMGMATLLRARAIALIATGVEKADAVGAALSGAITTQLPASFLQLHSDVEVYLDTAAASRLET
jgi:glucosamine-6-phosphate deaminase